MSTDNGADEGAGLNAVVSAVRLQGGVLDLNGLAHFDSVPVTGFGQIRTSLVLTSGKQAFQTHLGGERLRGADSSDSDSSRPDYSYAGITTAAHTGIPLARLPFGRWVGTFLSTQGALSATAESPKVPDHDVWNLLSDRVIGSRTRGQRWEITTLPVIGRDAVDAYFEEVHCSFGEGQLLFLEGYFVPRGRDIADWVDIRFSLSIVESGSGDVLGRVVRSLPLAGGSKDDASRRSGEPWRDQSKGYYATPNYEGIALEHLAEGDYELYVSARIGDDVQTRQLASSLIVRNGWSGGRKPKIGVIGSCVTRDNFSSRVVKRWRSDYEFQGAHYQMSLVSLMASPALFEPEQFGDLNAHDATTTGRDFSKEYLKELELEKPDFLLIDVFADARFGVVEFGGTWVTDNSWKLGAANHYAHLREANRSNMRINEDDYLVLFRSACVKLRGLLAEVSPRTQVILVAAKAVSRFRSLQGTGEFPDSRNGHLNTHWGMLDKVLQEVFECPTIDPMSGDIFGDGEHPWGRGQSIMSSITMSPSGLSCCGRFTTIQEWNLPSL